MAEKSLLARARKTRLLNRIAEREDEVIARGRINSPLAANPGKVFGEPFYDRDPQEVATEFAVGFPLIVAGVGAKTANLVKLSLAKKMHKAGKPLKEITQRTGWWRGPDKKWRFEISDDVMKFTDKADDLIQSAQEMAEAQSLDKAGLNIDLGGRNVSIHDAIRMLEGFDQKPLRVKKLIEQVKHDPLMKAYPEIGKIKLGHRVAAGEGSFNPKTKAIDIFGRGRKEAKKLLAHELQHWVQKKEGFIGGSSPDLHSVSLDTPTGRKLRHSAARKHFGQEYGDLPFVEKQNVDWNVERWMKDKKYRNVLGELEAETTASRVMLGPLQRKAIPFRQALKDRTLAEGRRMRLMEKYIFGTD